MYRLYPWRQLPRTATPTPLDGDSLRFNSCHLAKAEFTGVHLKFVTDYACGAKMEGKILRWLNACRERPKRGRRLQSTARHPLSTFRREHRLNGRIIECEVLVPENAAPSFVRAFEEEPLAAPWNRLATAAIRVSPSRRMASKSAIGISSGHMSSGTKIPRKPAIRRISPERSAFRSLK